MGRRKSIKTREQILEEKRLVQKLWYARVKSDPALWEIQQRKEKEKYRKKRELRKRKLKGEMTYQERQKQKAIWKKWNDRRRERRQKVKESRNVITQSSHNEVQDLSATVCGVPIPKTKPLTGELTAVNSAMSTRDKNETDLYNSPVQYRLAGSSNERKSVWASVNPDTVENEETRYSEILGNKREWRNRIERDNESPINITNQPYPYQMIVKQDVLDDLIEVKYELDDNSALYPYVQLDADEDSNRSDHNETVTLYSAEPEVVSASLGQPKLKRLRIAEPDDELPISPADVSECSTSDLFVDNPMADDGEDEARALGDFVSAEMRRIRSETRRKSLRKTIEEAVKAMVEEDEKEFFQDPATDPLS